MAGFQCNRHLGCHDLAGSPILYVGRIQCPDLIGMPNIQFAQQVGINLMTGMFPAGAGFAVLLRNRQYIIYLDIEILAVKSPVSFHLA
jgi:hypothetical protein